MSDYFEDKAQDWDKDTTKTSTPLSIATAIKKKFTLNKNMSIMDFGVGTGLLGFEIAKDVKKVFGVDMSPSMLKKLREKNSPELSIEAIEQDIVKEPLSDIFDGIVSSMTLHHVEDLEAFFRSIYKNLSKDGFIAIADLEKEDGTFHSDNTGVYHFGFIKEDLCEIVKKCGFKDITFENITTINKPQRDFGVFLLSAKR
ncbi:class I SAM-dependent methyltransferase [Sulfurimonas sp. SAG-AH-194-C21]|nr:class I SAM-dependent methyltransferase [Sulfurimonas sp. SAG-AH-194-C21]MDF1884508.1 class I SAM-dependent methyltransferase [Sulfurimonas sp. SAG-AH-194-C21]